MNSWFHVCKEHLMKQARRAMLNFSAHCCAKHGAIGLSFMAGISVYMYTLWSHRILFLAGKNGFTVSQGIRGEYNFYVY